MAWVNIHCPNCGSEFQFHVGQVVREDRLLWNCSYHCTLCGYALEEEGEGLLTGELRDAIIAEEGECALCVEEVAGKEILYMRAFFEALEISLADAYAIVKRLPGIAVTGTRMEMEWLQSRLVAKGLDATVCPAPDSSDSLRLASE